MIMEDGSTGRSQDLQWVGSQQAKDLGTASGLVPILIQRSEPGEPMI